MASYDLVLGSLEPSLFTQEGETSPLPFLHGLPQALDSGFLSSFQWRHMTNTFLWKKGINALQKWENGSLAMFKVASESNPDR